MAKLKHAATGRLVDVPESLAKGYRAAGWADAPVAPKAPVTPEGEPTADWKVDQLKAYAAERGIDLGEASKKADIVEVIAAAQAGGSDSTPEK